MFLKMKENANTLTCNKPLVLECDFKFGLLSNSDGVDNRVIALMIAPLLASIVRKAEYRDGHLFVHQRGVLRKYRIVTQQASGCYDPDPSFAKGCGRKEIGDDTRDKFNMDVDGYIFVTTERFAVARRLNIRLIPRSTRSMLTRRDGSLKRKISSDDLYALSMFSNDGIMDQQCK